MYPHHGLKVERLEGRGHMRIRIELEKIQEAIRKFLDDASSFFEFIGDAGGNRLTKNFSVKNEKFKITIPLNIIISTIKKLIVFKLAIMYKLIKHNMLEMKARSERSRCQHADFDIINHSSSMKNTQENLCQVPKSLIAFF
ncbi:hypothetical protein [Pantoea ananatis]|uniref:hypothetical protein n=1 Tax=Pantoea ananas TaxID=553 RepID=UPI001B3035EA|nr:hypothetical protein [Pantoea ananatis]